MRSLKSFDVIYENVKENDMFSIKNFMDNQNINILDRKGVFRIVEHKSDQSVSAGEAQQAYFEQQMNVRRRQLLVELNNDVKVSVQPGAMQWTLGNVDCGTGIKGVGDLIGKAFSSKVTKEAAIKPEYYGSGLLMIEPTYKHIILVDVSAWGSIVLEDGLFLASDSNLTMKTVMRKNVSSAVAGGEGLFNLCLSGSGIAALESSVPETE